MMKIKMKMKEISKMNVTNGKKNHQCCMWVKDGSLVNRGDSERQREIQNVKTAGWVYAMNINQQKMRKSNQRNGNNSECVIRDLASVLNAYNPNINSGKG